MFVKFIAAADEMGTRKSRRAPRLSASTLADGSYAVNARITDHYSSKEGGGRCARSVEEYFEL